MTDQIKKVAVGWCFTCDTNDCEHMSNATQSLLDSLHEIDTEPAMKVGDQFYIEGTPDDVRWKVTRILTGDD